MQIEFINHASVKFYTNDAIILTDPWYEGYAFDSGWDLIYTSKEMETRALEDVTHIWISHEHPDHFVPAFFKNLSESIKSKIEILFQETKDQRVAKFLQAQNFRVREIKPGKIHNIGKTEIQIYPSKFYDSYLWIKDEENSILNINDCPIRDKKSLLKIHKKLGDIDVLLSQFSYAAWKGGRNNRNFRIRAAKEKLDTFALQANTLKAKFVIPFASFVRFCHEENSYLNDSINTIDTVIEREDDYQAKLVVMKPFQKWIIGEMIENGTSADFWRTQYGLAKSRKLVKSGLSLSLRDLYKSFLSYQKRLFKQNNLLFMKFLRYNPFLRGLEPVKILISDLSVVIEISIIDGFKIVRDRKEAEVEINTSVLDFVFKNDFGFDTMTVNGRFEATHNGFSKMTKSFSLGSLNALGLSLNLDIIKRLDVIMLLLDSLKTVEQKLKKTR